MKDQIIKTESKHIYTFSIRTVIITVFLLQVLLISFLTLHMAKDHLAHLNTRYMIAIAIFSSIAFALFFARLISSPILKLDKKVRAISKGEWQSEPIPSRIKEIDCLAVEVYKMKNTIQTTIEELNEEVKERKQAETFLQDIIDNNPISIQIVDKQGYTIQSNAANVKLFGLAPPPDFCVFDDYQIKQQGQEDLLTKAKNGEVVYLPDMYYNIRDFNPSFPDNPIWVKVVIFPIKGVDGKPERFVLMHEDVTNRKLIEKALINAKESAETNNRLKSSFLANMSHELRTPLSGILGFSELLVDNLHEDMTRDMAKMINQSGNRLLNTLNLILDLSQIEANARKVQNRVFNITSLLQEIISLFEPVASKKGITLTLNPQTPNLHILSDHDMLEHVLNELICNAIKYTVNGGVTVSMKVAEAGQDDDLIIEVYDTGIGISQENQESIFDAFRQVSEGWDRSFEGTGLGLTICKKYVNLLDGNITLESEIDVGSKFILSLPSHILQIGKHEISELVDNVSKTGPSVSNMTTSLPKILLVDDDDMCSKLVTRMLANVAEIVYTESGSEGLDLVKEHKFDAVLLDINLKKGISGLDVVKEIRAMENYVIVPVIALTAYAMLDGKEKLLSYGFSDYISKPFTTNQLTTTVNKWIRT